RNYRAPSCGAREEPARDPGYRGLDRERRPPAELRPCSASRGAAQVLAAAGAAQKFAVIYNQFAARDHLPDVAADLEALEHRVVHAHVMGAGADRVFGGWIPDHDIRVAAGFERTFA